MTRSLDALEKYLSESAYDMGAKRPDEFTSHDYVALIMAKHGVAVSNPNARYRLHRDVQDGKLKSRRVAIDGKFVNLYSPVK